MRVIQGHSAERRATPLEEAYAHFRLDRQGLPVSPATLRLYEHTIGRFLRWVRVEHPEVRRFEDLDVVVVREYRAALAARPGLRGKPIQPETLSGSDRALRTFFRWASAEGYPVADRILALPKVRVPWKEPTLFHLRQLRELLAACNPRLPQEGLAVRLLVGAGVRRLELCGLALEGPDGLPDLNVDSLDRGVVELRVRGEAGAKGMRARRVPVVPKLGAEIKRYVARNRPEVECRNLLISSEGRPFGPWGVDALMDRLTERVDSERLLRCNSCPSFLRFAIDTTPQPAAGWYSGGRHCGLHAPGPRPRTRTGTSTVVQRPERGEHSGGR